MRRPTKIEFTLSAPLAFYEAFRARVIQLGPPPSVSVNVAVLSQLICEELLRISQDTCTAGEKLAQIKAVVDGTNMVGLRTKIGVSAGLIDPN